MLGINTPTIVCAVATVAYVKGDRVKQITTKDGTFNLVKITVVGVPTVGDVRPVVPQKQVTIFRPKGQER